MRKIIISDYKNPCLHQHHQIVVQSLDEITDVISKQVRALVLVYILSPAKKGLLPYLIKGPANLINRALRPIPSLIYLFPFISLMISKRYIRDYALYTNIATFLDLMKTSNAYKPKQPSHFLFYAMSIKKKY